MSKKIDKTLYIKEESANDIVSFLVLELMLREKGAERTVKIPLGVESKDLTFKELGDLALVIYCDDYDSNETYGFSYSLEEKEIEKS